MLILLTILRMISIIRHIYKNSIFVKIIFHIFRGVMYGKK